MILNRDNIIPDFLNSGVLGMKYGPQQTIAEKNRAVGKYIVGADSYTY
jgi:hypothetical protein